MDEAEERRIQELKERQRELERIADEKEIARAKEEL